MSKKYELTNKTKTVNNKTLYQIKSLTNFGTVSVGELGGWIEKESNLSQDGNCWVCGDYAWVYGDARVYGDAWVSGCASVFGNARVYGDAEVAGCAKVSGCAKVYGNASIHGAYNYTKGHFIGGGDSDSDDIADITEYTDTVYWKHQYVLGEYLITPQEEEEEEVQKEAPKQKITLELTDEQLEKIKEIIK